MRLETAHKGGDFGLEYNAEHALKWHLKSAEDGDADAQWRLGVARKKATSAWQPTSKRRWSGSRRLQRVATPTRNADSLKPKMAAKGGDGKAQYRLRWNYQNEKLGLAIDLKMARMWFQTAAEGGDVYAHYSLGWTWDINRRCW
jgi:TPR repeat protein